MSETNDVENWYSQTQIDEIIRIKQVAVPWPKIWAWNLGFTEENHRAPNFNEMLEMVRTFDAKANLNQ